MPTPRDGSNRSPVPAYIVPPGPRASVEIARLPSASLTLLQLAPPLLERHRPPLAEPIRSCWVLAGLPKMTFTRPPMLEGPSSVQAIPMLATFVPLRRKSRRCSSACRRACTCRPACGPRMAPRSRYTSASKALSAGVLEPRETHGFKVRHIRDELIPVWAGANGAPNVTNKTTATRTSIYR